MEEKPKSLGPETPAGDAAAAILQAKARKMFALEKAAASGADADAVHDMRVASRRLRASMQIFEPLYRRKSFRRWYGIGRGVTKSLGKVRDADVFIEAFRRLTRKRSLTDGQRIAIAYIVGHRQGERIKYVARLNRRLAKMDLAGAQKGFSRFASKHRESPFVSAPLSEFARDTVPQRFESVLGYLPAALVPENSEAQHAMRIEFKQLRYAIETLSPCFDGDVDEVIALTKEFQDALGDLHDYDVFIETVRTIRESSDARAAGVDDAHLEEVLQLLQTERDKRFKHFRFLIRRNGQRMLRSLILGSLARGPEEQWPIAEESSEAAGVAIVARVEPATDIAEPRANVGQPAVETPDAEDVQGGVEPVEPAAATVGREIVQHEAEVGDVSETPVERVDMPIPEESTAFGPSRRSEQPAESP